MCKQPGIPHAQFKNELASRCWQRRVEWRPWVGALEARGAWGAWRAWVRGAWRAGGLGALVAGAVGAWRADRLGAGGLAGLGS